MNQIIKISRPRFWIYVLGPFLLPIALISDTSSIVPTVIMLLYFTLPANLLIYGINDIYDTQTDILNEKKKEYEQALDEKRHRHVYITMLILNIPFWVYTLYYTNTDAIFYMVIFITSSWQYSAYPLRAKAIPFIDSLVSSIIYIAPALVSYAIIVKGPIDPYLVSAGLVWAFAMHMYSAIPDITADLNAKIKTGANIIGKNYSIIFCAFLYLGSAILGYRYLGSISIIVGITYLYMMLISFNKTEKRILDIYKYFPIINTIIGAIIFFYTIYLR